MHFKAEHFRNAPGLLTRGLGRSCPALCDTTERIFPENRQLFFRLLLVKEGRKEQIICRRLLWEEKKITPYNSVLGIYGKNRKRKKKKSFGPVNQDNTLGQMLIQWHNSELHLLTARMLRWYEISNTEWLPHHLQSSTKATMDDKY